MKKINLLIAVGLMASASMQAQTTIASVGFESGDQKYTTTTAYTPGGTYGNWVNKQEADAWNEQYTGDKRSGEYAFLLENTDTYKGNTWDRGFVVGNLQLKDNTSYRVSFWVKAEPTYFYDGENGMEEGNTSLKSSLFIGHEYCDMPISTKSGEQYYYNYTSGMTGEWRHISYITFFTNKADQDALSENYAGKEDPNGEIPMPVGSGFPEEYGLIINMYNPGDYVLDDIKVEEGVTFNEATFVDDVIRLDFGYPTNIADLAKANGGVITLAPSCVSVTVNGTAAPVEFVEGQSDGYLYIFLEDTYLDEDDDVKVSFTPAADCPILYNGDKRPSADTESEMQVLGFTNETAYAVDEIDVLPSAWSPAEFISSVPENDSFELDGATLNNVSFTYNKALDLSTASATLSWSDNFGNHTEDLTSDMTLSEDGMTINVAVSGLDDGEYDLTLSGVANSYGVECLEDQKITFALGIDDDTSVSEEVYVSDFDNGMTDGVPQGWLTKDETGIHQYGFMDEAQTIQYNYGWGHKGDNPNGTEGGARLYQGFSGDFQKALYWCSRGTNEGYASYGEIVKDYLLSDGTIDPSAPEGIALVLEPRKYQISFTMAAWKGEPVFRFTLEDLEGNVYAKFNDYVAKPNMNGSTGKVSGSLKCTTDFTVDKEGFYVLKFASQDAPWQEFLLANVKLITMPSKASYYKNQLKEALEKAEPIIELATPEEYDGETKTAFVAAVNKAKTEHFTSGSQVEAMIAELETLGEKMETRVNNIDDFGIEILNASVAYDELEGKYKNAEIAQEAKALLDQYETVNPSTLSDEELNEVTPKVKTVAAQIENVVSVVDILTWGAYKAYQVADKLGADGSAYFDLATDDRDVVNSINAASTIELYKKIAAGEDLDPLKSSAYDNSAEAIEEIPEDNNGEYDADGYPRVIFGIDFTGMIQNPHFYTYATNQDAALEDNTVTGWMCTQLGGTTMHLRGAATAEKPVEDVMLNGLGAEYKFYQVLENLPVGTYDVYIGTRTGTDDNGVPYNDVNDETNIWDKYIFAQVDGADAKMTKFAVGSAWAGLATVIHDVTVEEGQTLTIGVVENYTSGKAQKNGEPKDYWDSNTFVDDARLFFVAPLANYDYAKAAADMETGIDAVATAPAAKTNAIYNLAGQRVNGDYKGIVIKNGKKVLVK